MEITATLGKILLDMFPELLLAFIIGFISGAIGIIAIAYLAIKKFYR